MKSERWIAFSRNGILLQQAAVISPKNTLIIKCLAHNKSRKQAQIRGLYRPGSSWDAVKQGLFIGGSSGEAYAPACPRTNGPHGVLTPRQGMDPPPARPEFPEDSRSSTESRRPCVHGGCRSQPRSASLGDWLDSPHLRGGGWGLRFTCDTATPGNTSLPSPPTPSLQGTLRPRPGESPSTRDDPPSSWQSAMFSRARCAGTGHSSGYVCPPSTLKTARCGCLCFPLLCHGEP